MLFRSQTHYQPLATLASENTQRYPNFSQPLHPNYNQPLIHNHNQMVSLPPLNPQVSSPQLKPLISYLPTGNSSSNNSPNLNKNSYQPK